MTTVVRDSETSPPPGEGEPDAAALAAERKERIGRYVAMIVLPFIMV